MTSAGSSFSKPAKFGNGGKRAMQVSPAQTGRGQAALSKHVTEQGSNMKTKPRASKGMMK